MSEHINKPLKEWREDYENTTGTISEIVRNLMFAGIGVIWIFRVEGAVEHILPNTLFIALGLIVFGLITDLIQYIWKALNIYIFYEINDKKYNKGKLTDTDIEDIKFPAYIEVGTWFFFFSKIFILFLSYWQIAKYLLDKI